MNSKTLFYDTDDDTVRVPLIIFQNEISFIYSLHVVNIDRITIDKLILLLYFKYWYILV